MPRAMLLPPEIVAETKARSQRRGLIAILVLVLVVVGGAYAGVTFLAQNAQNELQASRDETTDLLAQQAQYAEVQIAQSKSAGILADRAAATEMEIDWEAYLQQIVDTLPGDATLQSIAVTSSTPGTPIGAPTSPLDNERVAEIVLTAQTKDVPDIVEWIDALSTLPGYADSTPTSVASAEGGYQVNFMLHVNDTALWGRFAPDGEAQQ